MPDHHRCQTSRGFTLIELLVVVALIALVAAILLASLKPARDNTRAVTCMSNIRQTGLLLQMYLGTKPIPEDLKRYRLNIKFTDATPARSGWGIGPVLLHVLPPKPPPLASAAGGESTTTFFGETGCTVAGDNPSFVLDPANEPPRRSYGANLACLGKTIDKSPEWLFADSDFSHITFTGELAKQRHHQRVNLFFKDGHAALTMGDSVKFVKPPDSPQPGM